ncbi:hypothetical protein D9613_007487 [Agrocybe pediades]|uniref:Zinc transporter n=1 Tax=Agrocybe pediades TaxID=84607 RepID=A0A8H4VLA6_9AGAR|nr:hypothetical protein D9613_007487 [Agrocybe pediades]
MTVMSRYRNKLLFLVALLSLISLEVHASAQHESKSTSSTSQVLSVFENEIEKCPPIQRLSVLKETLEAQQSPIMRTVFSWLFPFGPAWNSILGTFYISSVPNFILAFIPAQINANTLNTMTAFATGGLLSDVFLHLVPHSFMGEHSGAGVHFVMVEEKRNILVGLGIFVGFASFFFMEKTLRVLGGDEEGAGHSHSHSHSHSTQAEPETAKTTGLDASAEKQNTLRSRNTNNKDSNDTTSSQPLGTTNTSANGSTKLSAYLNLFGDFVHNITDGLAMAASFYASPLIGATTTLACFAHEIPHEIADYSILIRSGFTKKQAMQSQFLTAVGAFVGTFIGIAVHNATATDHGEPQLTDLAAGVRQDATGLLGTTLQISELVRPPPKVVLKSSLIMGTKGRAVPRVVCCAIPIARAAGKVLVVTSRKRPNNWCQKVVGNRRMCSWRLQPQERLWKKVLPFAPLSVSSHFDSRLSPYLLCIIACLSPIQCCPAFTHITAGVRGTITRYVITIPSPSATYHFYELDVAALDQDWLERNERRREWVDYAEAVKRLEWKAELAQGLRSSSLAR